MSQEIIVTAALTWRKGDQRRHRSYPNMALDSAGTSAIEKVLSIGTSEEQVSLDDVGAGAIVLARNLDPTNYVQLRASSGGDEFARLRPQGSPVLVPLDDSAAGLYAQADTAACLVEFIIVPVPS